MTSCLAWCRPDWTCSTFTKQVGDVRQYSLQLRQHPPSWHRHQRVQLNTHIHEFVQSVRICCPHKTLPLQKQRRQYWLPSAGISVSQNQFWLCAKFTQWIFLLNDCHGTREFLIGTDKLEWAEWIWKRLKKHKHPTQAFILKDCPTTTVY